MTHDLRGSIWIMSAHDLLELALVGDVCIVVNAACIEPSATHCPFAAGYQDKIKVLGGGLAVDVALDQGGDPVVWDFLNVEVLADVVVPHETPVNDQFAPYSRLGQLSISLFSLVSLGLLLQARRQIISVCKVEA